MSGSFKPSEDAPLQADKDVSYCVSSADPTSESGTLDFILDLVTHPLVKSGQIHYYIF